MPQTMAVKLTDDEIELIQKLIVLHHKLGDIPQPTASALLRWLLTTDLQRAVDDAQKRQRRITG